MTTSTKAPKRRSVSKPRLLKELRAVMAEYNIGADAPIVDLDEAIQEAIVADAMKA